MTGITIPFPVIPTPPALPVSTDFTVASSPCTATLLAHTSCTISIAFTPTAIGQRQASITVSDAQGDLAMINLTGYGDDYQLQIAPGQPAEITIIPGAIGNIQGQVVSDGVFGCAGRAGGVRLPLESSDSDDVRLQPVPRRNHARDAGAILDHFCDVFQYGGRVAPHGWFVPREYVRDSSLRAQGARETAELCSCVCGAILLARVDLPCPRTCHDRRGTLAMLAFGFTVPSRRRATCALGVVVFAVAVLEGCHHAKVVPTGTPVGTTDMVIQGQALDASGNPLNASRPMPQITLGVVNP